MVVVLLVFLMKVTGSVSGCFWCWLSVLCICYCCLWCLIVARNNLHQVEVSDIDLTAEFHSTPQVTKTVP